MSYSDKIKEISDKINTAKKTCIDNLNKETNNSKKKSIINEYYTFIEKIYKTSSYLMTCRISYEYRECESKKKEYYKELLNIFSYDNLMKYKEKSTSPLLPNYNFNISTYNDGKFRNLIKDCQEKIQEKIENHNLKSKSKSGGKKNLLKKTTTKKPKK